MRVIDVEVLEGADDSPIYDIRRNLGVKADDTTVDETIAAMTVEEAFERYLTWNGIIGYAETFLAVVDALREAELPGDEAE